VSNRHVTSLRHVALVEHGLQSMCNKATGLMKFVEQILVDTCTERFIFSCGSSLQL